MRTFMISYDLAAPALNKHAIATVIMSLGTSWARPLEQTWFVRADTDEQDVMTRLAPLLQDEDGLIVQSVTEAAVLANTQLRWFRQRRPAFDIEGHTNVVAFPGVSTAPISNDDFPLAANG